VTHILPPSAPCAPQNVTASLVCENQGDNTAQVSWLASGGAVRYEVVALGRDGDSKQCNTTGTTCSLPNMHCAETYSITVTPYSNTCVGFTSTPLIYIAGEFLFVCVSAAHIGRE